MRAAFKGRMILTGVRLSGSERLLLEIAMQALVIALCLSVTFGLLLSQGAQRSLDHLASREEFDSLARVEFEGRFNALPNVMFTIDRLDNGRVYYINSRHYRFHQEFLAANYLTLERGRKFYQQNYLSPQRRFLLGTIAWHAREDRFTFEFWEGDLTTPELLGEAYRGVAATFFAPLYFKPNSVSQRTVADQRSDVPHLSPKELDQTGDYVALNLASSVGVLRIIDQMSDETILDRNEIVIFREPPLRLTPCSGVITTTFGTPLAHVNLLAHGWGIPNAFIRDAAEAYRPLEGKFVYFEVTSETFILRPAATSETVEYGRRMAARSDLLTPSADLEFRSLTSLTLQRKTDAKRFGAKSANLGEVVNAIRNGLVRSVSVPPGFAIPFFHYSQFLQQNGLERSIIEMLANDRFNHDPAFRRQSLAELRRRIEEAPLDPRLAAAVWSRKQAMFGKKGVFVRSSTNAEDLDNFSGAGLYTTVPNVRGRDALLSAIKVVWASLWNYEAYEARESAGINQAAVYPAVLIQEGVPADTAGVLLTRNPFDKDDTSGVYINAKRGLGLRVVSGQRVPEQIVFDPSTGAIRILTRSGDDTMLTFDEKGGLREVRIETERRVLTDTTVRRISQAAMSIKQVFGGRDQDIEWVTVGPRIFIVQSRPFVD